MTKQDYRYTRTRLCDECGKPFPHDWKHTVCTTCKNRTEVKNNGKTNNMG